MPWSSTSKHRRSGEDFDDLLKEGLDAEASIERVIDQLWAMMGTSVEGFSEAA